MALKVILEKQLKATTNSTKLNARGGYCYKNSD